MMDSQDRLQEVIGVTQREIRERARTMAVGEDLHFDTTWILSKLNLRGLWMIWSMDDNHPSRVGTLAEVLAHKSAD